MARCTRAFAHSSALVVFVLARQNFDDALEWLCEELGFPEELEVQHPNFLASAFPCFQTAEADDDSARPQTIASSEPAARGAAEAEAEAKTTGGAAATGAEPRTETKTGGGREWKNAEQKFSEAV